MSPGRAASNAAAMASRRSGDQQEVVAASPAGGLGAAGDVVEDRLAVLAARILVGHDDEPCSFGGDPAHLRSLRGVALPGRAEDHDQATATRGRGRREQVEDRGERRRTVREVDHDAERLAHVHSFHPARHAGDAGQAVADAAGIEPECLAEGDHGERVVDVEAAGEREVERRLARPATSPMAWRPPASSVIRVARTSAADSVP